MTLGHSRVTYKWISPNLQHRDISVKRSKWEIWFNQIGENITWFKSKLSFTDM